APVLGSRVPNTVSVKPTVRIRGTGFSPTISDDAVYVNGYRVNVLSATATEIWANGFQTYDPTINGGGPPPYYGPAGTAADVTVVVKGEASNSFQVTVGYPGQPVPMPGQGVRDWTASLIL